MKSSFLILLPLFIAFLYGMEPFIYKHLLQNISKQSIILWTSFINLFFSAIYAYYYRNEIKKDNISLKILIILSALVILTIFITDVIYYHIIEKNSVSVPVVLIYTAPMFTLLLGMLFLNENISKYEVLGIIFVIIGILILAKTSKRD